MLELDRRVLRLSAETRNTQQLMDTPPSAHYVRIHLPLTQRPSFYKLAQ